MVANAGHKVTMGQFLRQHLAPIYTTIAVFAVLTAFTSPALAQPATCDPSYWEAMKSKAWMEAQREITQNQNLIYKADSVLEYTCFDRYLQSVATVIRTQRALFSETNHWTTSPPGNMINALNILVANSLPNYIGANFAHNYLGDRSGIDYTLGTAGGGAATYSCDQMTLVWQAAKCMNFINQIGMDDFFYLSQYNSMDPRQLPSGYSCTADTRWAAEISKATNDPIQYQEEPFLMYNNFFDISSCAAPPIPTGVEVTRVGIAPYQEHICANPGCSYNRSNACTTSPP